MADKQNILIMDDEPHLLEWLVEYLRAKGCATTIVTDITGAMAMLRSDFKFRILVLDLNVPAAGEYAELLAARGSLYETYRGLYVAEQARNMGYRGRQVIVYSVHDVDAVNEVTQRIGVTYATKGRPRAFKAEIDSVLSFDPSVTGGV